ncbi:MAG: hypothetical protein V1793_00125 [Pseudomonadota bacterium]
MTKRFTAIASLAAILILSSIASASQEKLLTIAYTGDLDGHITDEYG